MALINCPECGKEVSDKAKTCPNCGIAITKEPIEQPYSMYVASPSSVKKKTTFL